MLHINSITPTLLFSCFLLSTTLHANTPSSSMNDRQQTTPPPQRSAGPEERMGGKPPADAIEMCLGKSEKSSCTMNGPQGEEKGFCEHTPDQLYFACNPQRGPKQGPQSRIEPTTHNDQIGQNSIGVSKSQVTLYPSHLKNH